MLLKNEKLEILYIIIITFYIIYQSHTLFQNEICIKNKDIQLLENKLKELDGENISFRNMIDLQNDKHNKQISEMANNENGFKV